MSATNISTTPVYLGKQLTLVETDASWVATNKAALDAIDGAMDDLMPSVIEIATTLRGLSEQTEAGRKVMRALCVQAVDICEPVRELCGYTKGKLPEAYRVAKDTFFSQGLSASAYDKEVQRRKDAADPARVEARKAQKDAEKAAVKAVKDGGVVLAADRPIIPDVEKDDPSAILSVWLLIGSGLKARAAELSDADALVFATTAREWASEMESARKAQAAKLAKQAAEKARKAEAAAAKKAAKKAAKLPEAASAEAVAK